MVEAQNSTDLVEGVSPSLDSSEAHVDAKEKQRVVDKYSQCKVQV